MDECGETERKQPIREELRLPYGLARDSGFEHERCRLGRVLQGPALLCLLQMVVCVSFEGTLFRVDLQGKQVQPSI